MRLTPIGESGALRRPAREATMQQLPKHRSLPPPTERVTARARAQVAAERSLPSPAALEPRSPSLLPSPVASTLPPIAPLAAPAMLEPWRESQRQRGAALLPGVSIPGVSVAGDVRPASAGTASQAKRGALWAGIDESPRDAAPPYTPSSVPIRRLSRKYGVMPSAVPDATARQEQGSKAAVLIQSAARGRLTRTFWMASVALHEQKAAVERLRTRRRSTDPGNASEGHALSPALVARRVILDDNGSSRVRTVHC